MDSQQASAESANQNSGNQFKLRWLIGCPKQIYALPTDKNDLVCAIDSIQDRIVLTDGILVGIEKVLLEHVSEFMNSQAAYFESVFAAAAQQVAQIRNDDAEIAKVEKILDASVMNSRALLAKISDVITAFPQPIPPSQERQP